MFARLVPCQDLCQTQDGLERVLDFMAHIFKKLFLFINSVFGTLLFLFKQLDILIDYGGHFVKAFRQVTDFIFSP